MLAALALADYNVLDEWRKKMGGTVKSTVDPMTGHVSSLHRASSGTGWGGYEDGWDEELEARATGLVANVFSDMPLTELARDTKRRPELAQLMKAWFDPDPAGVAKEYEWAKDAPFRVLHFGGLASPCISRSGAVIAPNS